MKFLSHLNHAPIEVYFKKDERNFAVSEIPLYDFSASGEHLILEISKKGISTFELLKKISQILGIKQSEIGYCGLKDKFAKTTQFISIHKKFEPNISQIESQNIKIISQTYHKNKLKLGHLRGNRFFVKLKKVDKISAQKINQIAENLQQNGMPNYFGKQRFGNDENNFENGRAILEKKLHIKNKKMQKFLISSFQSQLFNQWLESRIKCCKIINDFNLKDAKSALEREFGSLFSLDLMKSLKNQPHFFKIFSGDVLKHYPHGKLFYEESNSNLDSSMRFYQHLIAPTGLICGHKTLNAINLAQVFEQKFISNLLQYELGERRFAWIFIQDLECIYEPTTANLNLHFTLPKGSYATIFLQILLNKEI